MVIGGRCATTHIVPEDPHWSGLRPDNSRREHVSNSQKLTTLLDENGLKYVLKVGEVCLVFPFVLKNMCNETK